MCQLFDIRYSLFAVHLFVSRYSLLIVNLFCSLFDYLFCLIFIEFCLLLFKREKNNSDPELCSGISNLQYFKYLLTVTCFNIII
jgi:hypothetical protein